MENTRGREFPCFLSRENDLEAVREEYFNPRLAEEEINEDEDFSDNSSGSKRIDIKLLPSSLTKCKLWKMYHDASLLLAM